jgi:hypothetical protein
MTTIKWIVPAFFDLDKSEKIEINVTKQIKTILKNKVWERSFEFGFKGGLEKTNPDSIVNAKVIIYKAFTEGVQFGDWAERIVTENCGEIEEQYKKVISDSKIDKSRGIAIIEVTYNYDLESIPNSQNQFSQEFILDFHRLKSVVEEISAFILAGLHLIYHCTYVIMPTMKKKEGGFLEFKSNSKAYYSINETSTFTFPVIILEEHIEFLQKYLDNLSGI